MQRRRRILLVDDESAVLEGLQESLRREPYVVESATSAAAALEVLAMSYVDVVVSDERMPGMKGSEFLSVVCQKFPGVMRIMLTGQASLEAAVRAINEGQVFRILLKPCAPDELRGVLRAAIEAKSLLEESSRLLQEARRRGRKIAELERKNPGISAVERSSDGTIHMDEADEHRDLGELLKEIERELGGDSRAA
jgi:DNA-binding NtrC family response regulator